MKIGMYVRVMGPQSTIATLRQCARSVEDAGLDEIWIADHIAIPPDDAEGSEGRYLDPLATLAWLSAVTERVQLGFGVLILPYRPMLPTAKAVATIQELSGGRLNLGVGVGWMEPEFKALGVDKRRRGKITDETLEFWHRCFDNDIVEANGQSFIFKPRPAKPPITVGGGPRFAFERIVKYGDSWMPTRRPIDKLRGDIAQLAQRMAAAGRGPATTVSLSSLEVANPALALEQAQALKDAGVDSLVVNWRYRDASEFKEVATMLAEEIQPKVAS